MMITTSVHKHNGNGDGEVKNSTTLRRRMKKNILTDEERERREKFNKSLLDLDTNDFLFTNFSSYIDTSFSSASSL